MNLLLAALMDKPNITTGGWCSHCGRWGTTEHHMIPKSQNPNWKTQPGPTNRLCGHGTAGCHGLAEDKRLHNRWRDGWEELETAAPTKYERAIDMEGWTPVRHARAAYTERLHGER